MHSVRLAIRSLLQTPAFSVVAVLALALGIGANSAIFSLVQAIFLKPLPYAEAERLVQISSSIPERNLDGVGFSWPRLQAVRERQDVFEQIAASAPIAFVLTGGDNPEQLIGLQVTHDYFPLLGVAPALGRGFLPEDDRPGAEAVVVLSHALWQRHFGGRPDAMGQVLQLDDQPHTVIGVMPQGLSAFPLQQVQVWTARPEAVPYLVPAQIDGGCYCFNVLARLAPGVSIEAARSQLATIADGYGRSYPDNADAPASADVEYLLDALIGDQRQIFLLLFGAVGCVLLIACANVANLVLTRYAGRRKQIAIRFALGATRRHVMRDLVTENIVLALLGGAVGLLLGSLAVELVVRLGVDIIPRAAEVSLDPLVVVFTLLVSLLTGLVLGLIPSLQLMQPSLTDALKDANRGSTAGPRDGRVRSSLMVAEVAVSFVLLIAATLLIGSFIRVQGVSPGFNPDGVFTGLIQVQPSKYEIMSEPLANFYGRVLEEMQAIPGVQSAALHDSPPLSGFAGPSPFAVIGQPIPSPREQPLALRHVVSPNAFELLEMPILAGRDFNERDTPGSPPVVIINQTMANQAFPDIDPIGQRILSGMLQLEQEVIGVVADTLTQDLTAPPTAEMFYSVLQRPEGFTNILLRGQGDPALLAGSVREALKAVDPTIPLTNVTTLAAQVEQTTADRRLLMALLAIFAGLALLLASVGVYGVMSYSVSQRQSEIGVRMALGAAAASVQTMVVRQGLLLSALGIAIGLVAALVLTRLMASLLFGIGASDPLVYLAITAVLTTVSVVACWLPARRAARISPLTALRG